MSNPARSESQKPSRRDFLRSHFSAPGESPASPFATPTVVDPRLETVLSEVQSPARRRLIIGLVAITGVALFNQRLTSPALANTDWVYYPEIDSTWSTPYWGPFSTENASGLPVIHRTGGGVDKHDQILKNAGRPGTARENLAGIAKYALDATGNQGARAALGLCREAAMRGITSEAPFVDEATVKEVSLTRQEIEELLIVQFIGEPHLAFANNPQEIGPLLDKFVQNNGDLPLIGDIPDGQTGQWFNGIIGVNRMNKRVLALGFGRRKEYDASAIRTLQVRRNPKAKLTPGWQTEYEAHKVKGLDRKLIAHIAYGYPYPEIA
jgi:hypothetical protein